MKTKNNMRNCMEDMNDVKIIEKIVRFLTNNFSFVVCIEESKDIDLLTVDELQSFLFVYEQNVKEKRSENKFCKLNRVHIMVEEEEETTFEEEVGTM